MGGKVLYDPETKLIIVTGEPVGGRLSLDVQVDLYSDAKEDWLANGYLSRFTFPWLSIGGQPTGGGDVAGQLYFLRNDLGWRIRPHGSDHEMSLKGNIYPNDATLPVFIQPTGTNSAFVATTLTHKADTVGEDGMTVTQTEWLSTTEKILSNRVVTDPISGTETIFEDDGITVFLQAELYEDATGVQRYRGQAAERRERLERP